MKKIAGLAKFLIENSSDRASVLLITKSYTFLFYSHCYLLQNIYGM